MSNVLNAAADCTSMEQVRQGVDAIDQELVALLTKRQAYMDAAARIKTQRSGVRDVARIEDVVAKVLARAAQTGLSPAIAEPLWRLLIDRSIAYELGVWDRLRSPTPAPASAGDTAGS
jgi:isochorismate pyruvate lyase